ncbi:MAG: hypothetical protein ABIS50_01555 [Luteolibacter sp.]|uniref:hypothetical protein n=1 Tax=Luteolibacter sp. TaxID=1962973 RepID=UPI0032661A77
MSNDTPSHKTEEIGDNFTAMLKPVEDSASTACECIRKEAEKMMSCASDKIRSNPLPAVAGAFAFGIAVGCLIISGRNSSAHDFDLREPLADASDTLSNSLRAVYENLKFW